MYVTHQALAIRSSFVAHILFSGLDIHFVTRFCFCDGSTDRGSYGHHV